MSNFELDSQISLDPRVQRTRKDVLGQAMRIMMSDSWDSLTYSRIAKESGYSRATIYSHWPKRIDLIRDALGQYQQIEHHQQTGELKADLHGEVVNFSRAMLEHRLDRVLASLAEHAQTDPEMVEIRQSFVAAGESPMRAILGDLVSGPDREAVVLMLCGMVSHSVLMHGKTPSKAVVNAAIKIVHAGLTKN